MYYAYVVENKDEDDIRDNQKLFRAIRSRSISEDNVFFDSEGGEIIEGIIEKLKRDDVLILKTIKDLGETGKDLMDVLSRLETKGIHIYAEEESGLNGTKYYSAFRSVLDISGHYQEKKRLEGYQEAKDMGRVGRPKKKQEIADALRLYKTGEFSISEIEKLSGVSKSTIFRYLSD